MTKFAPREHGGGVIDECTTWCSCAENSRHKEPSRDTTVLELNGFPFILFLPNRSSKEQSEAEKKRAKKWRGDQSKNVANVLGFVFSLAICGRFLFFL